ncbi:hypothetical protein, partial [Salmonella enterica]|uniref:hypothetical protein n=1 Tax=Salmonella enterica TaxID=28901 RepID=UPI001F457351
MRKINLSARGLSPVMARVSGLFFQFRALFLYIYKESAQNRYFPLIPRTSRTFRALNQLFSMDISPPLSTLIM